VRYVCAFQSLSWEIDNGRVGNSKRAAFPIRRPLALSAAGLSPDAGRCHGESNGNRRMGLGVGVASGTQLHAHMFAVRGFESPSLEKLDRLVSTLLDQHVNPRASFDPCSVAGIGQHG
jgi:hypothetical protein